MKKLEQGLDFLQRHEEKLWFWGVDRAEDLDFQPILERGWSYLGSPPRVPAQSGQPSVAPEKDVPAFAVGPHAPWLGGIG